MMTGATDSRHYAPICQNVFRFFPVFLTPEETKAIHGINERLSFLNAGRMVAFYQEIIRQESSLTREEELEEEHEETQLPEFETEPELAVRSMKKKDKKKRKRPPELEQKPLQSNEPDQFSEMEPLPEDDAPLEVKSLKKG
jgi:hypothetical protein